MSKIVRMMAIFLCAISLFAHAEVGKYDFKLTGPDGTVTEASFPDKYLLVFFGYANCPDICPTTLYEISRMLKVMQHPDKLQPIFISIDPSVDTMDKLSQYVHYFSPQILGVTADYAYLKQLANTYGASFGYRLGNKEVYPPNLPAAHSVYHSTLLYLLNPQGEMVDVFDYQIGYEEMAKHVDAAMAKAPPPAVPSETATPTAAASTQCPLPAGFNAYAEAKPTLQTAVGSVATEKTTLLNFWALWCGPCRKELPMLDKLSGEQSALAVLALNLDDDSKTVEKTFTQWGITHLQPRRVQDETLLNQYHGVGLPFSVLFNHGKPVATRSGVVEDTASLTTWAACASGAAHE